MTEGSELSSHDNNKRIIVTLIDCLLYASPMLSAFHVLSH